jgi:hypothetical protein
VSVTVDAPVICRTHGRVDGDALCLGASLHFLVLPAKLRVRVQANAPGAAPAAVMPAGPDESVAGVRRFSSVGRPVHERSAGAAHERSPSRSGERLSHGVIHAG